MFLVFPILFSGTIPITLLSHDEKSRWLEYSGSLPYSFAQIVSSKYIYGLLLEAISVLVTFAFLLLQTEVMGKMALTDALYTFGGMILLSLVVPSTSLPFCFRYGTEKGRYVYFVFILVMTWLLFEYGEKLHTFQLESIIPIVVTAVVVLYSLSWLVSVSFCKKRFVKG